MDELQRKQDDLQMKQLIIDYRNGNKRALAELFEICEPMAARMSKKYFGLARQKYIPIEDLKQECFVGLLGAVSHFPTDVQGNSFTSFAFSSMNKQMLVYIRENSNRIVKSDWRRGSVDVESMDKELTSFGELEDGRQEEEFRKIEADIDREIQKKQVGQMLVECLNSDSDIPVLRDMYGLDGHIYSIDGICEKYNISVKELIFRERLMILKIRNSRSLENYARKLDYQPKSAYHYGLQRFKNTGVSSTEFLAMKHLEKEGEQLWQVSERRLN